jgi:hypothetical protein
VRLLSDLQRRAFLSSELDQPPPTPAAPETAEKSSRSALFEQLDKLQALAVRVIVEDLGPADARPANLALVSVRPLAPPLGPNIPTDVSVEVKNFGASSKNGVRVVLEVDGERRPNQVVDLPARGRAEAIFPLVFKAAGAHTLVARLEEGDRLAIDNERAHVIAVPAAVRVLLVNGAPGVVIEEDEVGYLSAVLQPPGDDAPAGLDRIAPFEPKQIEPHELSATDLSAFDVVWIANVESLPAAVVESLEQFVAGGRALILSLGDRVDPATWNARLWRADDSGLLPAELRSKTEIQRDQGYYRAKSFAVDHPALRFFADEHFKPLFSEVPVYAFFTTKPGPSAQILATLDDDASNALLLERAYDRGRVFLWTSSIGTSWNRVAESPATLVPLAHEWLRYASVREQASRNSTPGSPLLAETTTFPRDLSLVRPDGTRRALDGEIEVLPAERWKLPAVPGKDTEKIGIYKIESEGAPPIAFAIALDALEGDLDKLSIEELDALHPALSAVVAGGTSGDADDVALPQRGELWRWVAIAMLVCLVTESIFAAWLGKKRSPRA